VGIKLLNIYLEMLLQAPTKMQRLDIWSYMVKDTLACVLSFLMLLLRLHTSLYG